MKILKHVLIYFHHADDNLTTNAKKRKNQEQNVKCIKFDTSIGFDFTKYCLDKRGEMYYQDNGRKGNICTNVSIMVNKEMVKN